MIHPNYKTFYKVLDIEPTASEDEILTALDTKYNLYFINKHLYNNNSANTLLSKLKAAYNVLIDTDISYRIGYNEHHGLDPDIVVSARTIENPTKFETYLAEVKKREINRGGFRKINKKHNKSNKKTNKLRQSKSRKSKISRKH